MYKCIIVVGEFHCSVSYIFWHYLCMNSWTPDVAMFELPFEDVAMSSSHKAKSKINQLIVLCCVYCVKMCYFCSLHRHGHTQILCICTVAITRPPGFQYQHFVTKQTQLKSIFHNSIFSSVWFPILFQPHAAWRTLNSTRRKKMCSKATTCTERINDKREQKIGWDSHLLGMIKLQRFFFPLPTNDCSSRQKVLIQRAN